VNQTVLLALIAAGSAIIGAILTFLAPAYPMRQKLKELELSYQQKVDEIERAYQKELEKIYRENARLKENILYRPLGRRLAELDVQHGKFISFLSDVTYSRLDPMPDKEKLKLMMREAVREYQQACTAYVNFTTDLLKKFDTDITGQFESSLRVFNRFIQDSFHILGDIPTLLRVLYTTRGGERTYADNRTKRFSFLRRDTKRTFAVPSIRKTINFNSPFEKHMVPAVITSDLYATRFEYGMRELKSFIREVTLGVKY